jgi:hypothetical protein
MTSSDGILHALHDRYNAVFEKTITEVADQQLRATAIQNVADFESCLKVIWERPEREVFSLALREYQYSLIAMCHGSYRQGFSALRLAFELWLSAVAFSASERDLRSWKARRQDIVWAKLISDENGVLSKPFVSLFSSSLESTVASFRVIAERLYRECSEYVHGNHHTHAALPEELTYDQATFRDWCSKAETLKLVCLYAFAFRYSDIIPGTGLAAFGAPIGDTLGHIPEIRQLV